MRRSLLTSSMKHALAEKLGVTRNKSIVVPCSGCGIGCHPVSPLDCFCIECYAEQNPERRRLWRNKTDKSLLDQTPEELASGWEEERRSPQAIPPKDE